MENIVYVNLFLFLVVAFICSILGLDLKKWQSWLVGLYGFLSGYMLGILSKSGSPSWQLGLLFTVVVMYSSAITRKHRLYYRKVGEKWLIKYGNDKQNSLLTRLIKKALGK